MSSCRWSKTYVRSLPVALRGPEVGPEEGELTAWGITWTRTGPYSVLERRRLDPTRLLAASWIRGAMTSFLPLSFPVFPPFDEIPGLILRSAKGNSSSRVVRISRASVHVTSGFIHPPSCSTPSTTERSVLCGGPKHVAHWHCKTQQVGSNPSLSRCEGPTLRPTPCDCC